MRAVTNSIDHELLRPYPMRTQASAFTLPASAIATNNCGFSVCDEGYGFDAYALPDPTRSAAEEEPTPES